jgi:hypothetical protein
MRQNTQSWQTLIFYGEVVGFVLAWVVGGVVLTNTRRPEPRLAVADGLAHAEVGLTERAPQEFK